jgi:hypothetical protein
VIAFRTADRRWPFLWESELQPPGRWHGEGEGPAHYLADTPDGAWAETVRHLEIPDPDDLGGLSRDLWAIEIPDDPAPAPQLPPHVLRGDPSSYAACRDEARRMRTRGETTLAAPSAALVDGGARGEFVRGGQVEADERDGRVLVLFGPRRDLRGWLCASGGRPRERLLSLVRPLWP